MLQIIKFKESYNVWFQKISIPPPQRELEIPRGWGGGGSKTQEIPEGRGAGRAIWFPDALRFNTDSGTDLAVQKFFLTHEVDLSSEK